MSTLMGSGADSRQGDAVGLRLRLCTGESMTDCDCPPGISIRLSLADGSAAEELLLFLTTWNKLRCVLLGVTTISLAGAEYARDSVTSFEREEGVGGAGSPMDLSSPRGGGGELFLGSTEV